jgi:hypothetical protein
MYKILIKDPEGRPRRRRESIKMSSKETGCEGIE